jgi:hypothetical protein
MEKVTKVIVDKRGNIIAVSFAYYAENAEAQKLYLVYIN